MKMHVTSENVVVSSFELARMFDSIKELGDAIKR